MTKKIVAIWAEDEAGLIGVDDRLPWRLPKELQHFKETTTGHALLMGRVTFDGMKRRILPGRQTLILTKNQDFQADGVQIVHSVQQALTWFAGQEKNLYIVGGASIYQAFEAYYDQLIQTTVHGRLEGDTYFPELDLSAFKPISETYFEADAKNPYAFTVKKLVRKNQKESN